MICLNKICNSPIFEKVTVLFIYTTISNKKFSQYKSFTSASNFFSILAAWK